MKIDPNNIRYPRSTYIKGIEWLTDRIPYSGPEGGDSYPMTWANDDDIYTSSGDPGWGPSPTGLDVEKFIGGPEDYKIEQINPMPGFVGGGGTGPKPTGMICVDGVLYLAVQNIKGIQPAPFGMGSQHGSDAHIFFDHHRQAWKGAT